MDFQNALEWIYNITQIRFVLISTAY